MNTVKLVSSTLTVQSKCYDEHRETGILPTAFIQILQDNSKIESRALFDTGAQKTFIHKDLISKLGLPISKSTTHCVDSFGSIDSSKIYNIVTINILRNEGSSIALDA